MLDFRRATETPDVSGSGRSRRPKAHYSSGQDSSRRGPRDCWPPPFGAHRPIKVVVEAGPRRNPVLPTGGTPPAIHSQGRRRADAHARGPSAHVAARCRVPGQRQTPVAGTSTQEGA